MTVIRTPLIDTRSDPIHSLRIIVFFHTRFYYEPHSRLLRSHYVDSQNRSPVVSPSSFNRTVITFSSRSEILPPCLRLPDVQVNRTLPSGHDSAVLLPPIQIRFYYDNPQFRITTFTQRRHLGTLSRLRPHTRPL